jgi:hypothetical protein
MSEQDETWNHEIDCRYADASAYLRSVGILPPIKPSPRLVSSMNDMVDATPVTPVTSVTPVTPVDKTCEFCRTVGTGAICDWCGAPRKE